MAVGDIAPVRAPSSGRPWQWRARTCCGRCTFTVRPASRTFSTKASAASRIWADGGSCELHVWPGGYCGFHLSAPGTTLAGAMIATRNAWLRRTLAV